MTDLSSSFQYERKVIYAGSSRQSRVYTRIRHFECMYTYTRTFMQGKVRTLGFGLWYLDHGIVIHGIGPR